MPIGLIVVPLALRRLEESRGADRTLDLAVLALASSGLVTLTWGIINGSADGWLSPGILGVFAAAAALLGAFVAWGVAHGGADAAPAPVRRALVRGGAVAVAIGALAALLILPGARRAPSAAAALAPA